MAWPKLRNKSSRSVTVRNRSGAAHDGARSQGGTAEGTPGGQARGSDVSAGTGGTTGTGGTGGPTAWPGADWPGADTQSTSGAAEMRRAETGTAGQRADDARVDVPPGGPAPAKRGFLRAMPPKARPAEARP